MTSMRAHVLPVAAAVFLDRVPRTASNFIDLCQIGFYEGIHFHRVIPGFMDQFGCPYAKDPSSPDAGTGGPDDGEFTNLATGKVEKRFNGGCIKDENISQDPNFKGTLSMANTGAPDSGGSQFFLNVAKCVIRLRPRGHPLSPPTTHHPPQPLTSTHAPTHALHAL